MNSTNPDFAHDDRRSVALTESRLKIADHCVAVGRQRLLHALKLCGEAERFSVIADSIREAAMRGERPRIRVNSHGHIMA